MLAVCLCVLQKKPISQVFCTDAANRDREHSSALSHSTVHTGPYTAPDQLLTEMPHRANRILHQVSIGP